MLLLDMDHMSLLDRGGTEGMRIRERLRGVPPDEVATTVVSYEEQMRGWLSRIAQAPTVERQVAGYAELKRQLRNYCSVAIVEFDTRALAEFERITRVRPRIGTMDLKIAAIVLSRNAILLSRNSKDFSRVPGLKVEDWSS